jgi:two-component system, NtrC family, nitrogen regulation response regulator GlnG
MDAHGRSPRPRNAATARAGAAARGLLRRRTVYDDGLVIDDDRSTFDPRHHARPRSASPHWVLTIALHPELARVGERCHVLERRVAIARNEPDFAAIAAAEAAPLGDRNLSRKAVVIELEPDAIVVDASASTTPVKVDGVAVGQRRNVAVGADGAAVLELGERVVLLVHRMASLGCAPGAHGMNGISEGLERVHAAIERVARSEVPVLVRGESGVGKELVARAVHDGSGRRGAPFVAVNMAAIPASTAAAELFGHERGAYTGAVGSHGGLFGHADGGTIFLDEIGACPVDVQALLLRALELGEVQPVGGQGPRRVDVRVIAATDEDLEGAVAKESFRLALLHRLAGHEIQVPPLRSRRDDIPPLLVSFLREELAHAPERLVDPGPSDAMWLPTELMTRLLRHDWPGNVRELRNVARRLAVALVERGVAALDGPAGVGEATPAPPRRAGDPGDEEIMTALEKNRWEVAGAARALGVPKTTLYRLIEGRVRTARDLAVDEILAARAEHGGRLARMAEALRVSQRGLRQRMAELGIE